MLAAILAAGLLGAPATPSATDTAQREALELASGLRQTRDPVTAAKLILKLGDLLPALGQLPVLQQALEVAADRPQLQGEAAALANRLGAALLVARGRPERAQELARDLGMVQSVAVLGPIDWSSTQACGLGGPVPPVGTREVWKPGDVHWRVFHDIAPLGRLGVDDLVSDRRDEAAVVAFTVTLPKPAHAALYYGSSAPSALALNGRWVAFDSQQHPEHFGQLRVPLDLPAGQSVLELELCRGNRPLQSSLRLADSKGGPLSGAVLDVPNAGTHFRSDHAKATKPVSPERGGLLFAEARRGDPEAAAVLAEQLTPFDDQDRRPIREREAACQAHPTQGCFLALAHDQELIGDKGARRGALDKASGAAPDHAAAGPGAALEIAESRYAADLGYPDRALLHARQAANLDPDDSRAALVLSQALETLGMSGLAGQLELAAAARWPESPEVLSAASYRLERLHREDDAIELLRREVALRDDLLGVHEALERLLLRRRDLDGALDQLAAVRRLVPSSPRSYVEEGKLLLANAGGSRRQEATPATPEPARDRSLRDRGPAVKSSSAGTQAEQAFQTALALGPANAEVWGEIAAAELRDGDSNRGHAALGAALMLAPQASTLRALAEGDQLREDPFATGELQDLKTVAAAASPSPGADAVSLGETTVVKVYASGLSSRVHQAIVRVQTQRGAQASRTVPIEYVPDRQDLRIEAARILKPNGDIVPTYEEASRSLSEPWYDLYYDLREDDITFPSLAPGDVLEVTYRLDDSAHENLLAQDFGDMLFLQDTIERRYFAYTIVMPKGRELFDNRPAVHGFPHAVAEQPDGTKVHRFIANDLPRLDAEPDMPGYAEVTPYLHVSTQQSWAAVGDYYWSLAKDQLAPSPALIETARKIAERAGADPAVRVGAAYDLVVSQTRYVGLELGIHGYKPYPVSEVLARGFGDCKDKASLLVSLLRELRGPGRSGAAANAPSGQHRARAGLAGGVRPRHRVRALPRPLPRWDGALLRLARAPDRGPGGDGPDRRSRREEPVGRDAGRASRDQPHRQRAHLPAQPPEPHPDHRSD